MTDDAFLLALRDDPLDDVTRSVYADWLEERGDARADFVRAEFADEAAMRRHATNVDEDWAFQAGRRWDVALVDYPAALRISVIKAVRELRDIGLTDGNRLVETPDAALLPGVPLAVALPALDHVRAVGPVSVGLRPASAATAFPVARGVPYRPSFEAQRFLRLTAVRPDRVMSAARAVAEVSNARLFQALDGCLGPLPLTITRVSGDAEARELAERFAGLATVERFDAPHDSPEGEWFDLYLGPTSDAERRAMGPGLVRAGRIVHERRLPRFFAEEMLARLAPLGPFTLRRSEDQP